MPGKDNIVAGALSRVADVIILASVDFPATAKDDGFLQSLKMKPKYTFRDYFRPIFGFSSSIYYESSDINLCDKQCIGCQSTRV